MTVGSGSAILIQESQSKYLTQYVFTFQYNSIVNFVILLICWFELVKLFQNGGTIDKLEYLFHKIGPQAGQPRGYAFLTFSKREEAIRARKEFDGKSLLGRTLLVKPARSVHKVSDLLLYSFH